jgi:hypothetical protein
VPIPVEEALIQVGAALHKMDSKLGPMEFAIQSLSGRMDGVEALQRQGVEARERVFKRLESLEGIVSQERKERCQISELLFQQKNLLDEFREEARESRREMQENRNTADQRFETISKTLEGLLSAVVSLRSEHLGDIQELGRKVRLPGFMTKTIGRLSMAVSALVGGFVTSMVWPDFDQKVHAAWAAVKTVLWR